MFGFGRKKTPPEPPSKQKRQRTSEEKEKFADELSKLGLLGTPSIDEDTDSEIDEADLEDELLAIIGADTPTPTPRKQSPKKENTTSKSENLRQDIVQVSEDSQHNILINQNATAREEEIFKAPPPPKTIEEALNQRLTKYKSELEKAVKNEEGASKIKRFTRIVKQYEDAIKSHSRDKAVNYEELPNPPGFAPIPIPTSSIQILKTQETQNDQISSDSPPDESIIELLSNLNEGDKEEQEPTRQNHIKIFDEPLIDFSEGEENNKNESFSKKKISDNEKLLIGLQKEYKEAALEAKRAADLNLARELLKISKGFDKLILDAESGVPIDMTTLPPPVLEAISLIKSASSAPQTDEKNSQSSDNVVTEENSAPESQQVDIFNAPPPPRTILEALEQRLEKYKSEVSKATEASKARRMGRIVKQYEEAINSYKKGKGVAFEDLPTPPGFAPIPFPQQSSVPQSLSPPSPPPSQIILPKKTVSSGEGAVNRGVNKSSTKLTLQEKQLRTLIERQREFKEAALRAKKRGDIEEARELLKTSKGFDKLILASQSGLPVDMATLPGSPGEVAALETSDSFEVVQSADCIPAQGSTGEIFSKLEQDLREQLKMCMRNREHLKSIGEIASANRFEKMAIETKKDLDALRLAAQSQQDLPKYHYETRVFSITECNSDLTEDEIEISLLKGINFKVANPTEVDTFVKIELPYPSAEEAQIVKTSVIRNTNNPDFDFVSKLKVSRSARNFQRFIHRHGIKLELWSKGGFLRSSTLLGTATIKLMPLETKCTLHDAFDVLDGRKPVGKLEVKVRLRDPVITKQITQKKEKWLSIDRV